MSHRLAPILTVILLSIAAACPAQAARCGTSLRADLGDRVERISPVSRAMAPRVVVPEPGFSAHAHVTEHFRILWGDAFDRADPEWGDPDGNGVPTWVQVLAEALEEAIARQRSLGFAAPYGVDRYYLDVFVGNTGAQVSGRLVQLGEDYYGYTAVDLEHRVAYFVFNDDFSTHVRNELPVLRATAAHELFHAVQRVYYPWDDGTQVPLAQWRRDGWWFEATATWMEEVCTPDVDDYVSFVRGFLAAPERPLFAMDGWREYGAAIFPGYLWLRRGGAALWTEVFAELAARGLEPALDRALAARGTNLPDEVGRFWSLAGHPEDLWPDGARYRSPVSPALLVSGSSLPVSLETTDRTAPERFGANLLRLRAGVEPVDLAWGNPSPDRVLVGASTMGSAETAVALAEAGRVDGSSSTADLFVALVNISPEEGPLAYRTVLQGAASPAAPAEPPQSDSAGDSSDGGGSGGCFLGVLSRP